LPGRMSTPLIFIGHAFDKVSEIGGRPRRWPQFMQAQRWRAMGAP
jgi:hypothetical protein